jgi:hypothetical protein
MAIAVLRKRVEFANAEALEEFLVDLSEYEEKMQVRSHSVQLSDCQCLKPLTSRKDECVWGSTCCPRQHVDARRSKKVRFESGG